MGGPPWAATFKGQRGNTNMSKGVKLVRHGQDVQPKLSGFPFKLHFRCGCEKHCFKMTPMSLI